MKRSILLLLCVVLCAAPLGANGAAVDRISSVVAGFQLTTPEENIFRVQGSDKEFVLLDVDSNGDCFILANDFYGTRQFDSVNATAKFDVESPSNIAYFLNHDFLTSGNTTDGKTYQLPEEIVEYIDFNREWKTEAGRGTSDVPNDYTVKAGVVLLSQTEWAQYASKFGDYDPTTTIFGYWLRTSRGKGVNQTNAILCARVTDTNGTTNNAPSDKYELIRLLFI